MPADPQPDALAAWVEGLVSAVAVHRSLSPYDSVSTVIAHYIAAHPPPQGPVPTCGSCGADCGYGSADDHTCRGCGVVVCDACVIVFGHIEGEAHATGDPSDAVGAMRRALLPHDPCSCDEILREQMKREGTARIWSWHNARCEVHQCGYAEQQRGFAAERRGRIAGLREAADRLEAEVFTRGSALSVASHLDAAANRLERESAEGNT